MAAKIIPVEKIKTVVSFDKLGSKWCEKKFLKCKEFFPDWLDIPAPDAIIKTAADGHQYNALAAKIRDQKAVEYSNGGIFIYHEGCYLENIIEMMQKKAPKKTIIYEV